MRFADEDVKIYHEESNFLGNDGEKAAAEFIYHRDNGDFDKTRQVGELLAQTLVDAAGKLEGQDAFGAKTVLVSYLAVVQVESDISNQILQKSVLGEFSRTLEGLSSDIFCLISDSAAFTLYILNERQGEKKTLGQVMAELIGREDDQKLIQEGDRLVEEYRGVFSGILRKYTFG